MKDRYYYHQSPELLDEALILKRLPEQGKLAVVSDLADDKARRSETFKNKTALAKSGFRWDNNIGAWTIADSLLQQAQTGLNTINKTENLISTLEDVEVMVASSDAPNKNDLSSKIKMFIEDLANATDEAAADAKIKQYLTFFGKLRKRSFTNNILIFIQNPEATHVEGFKTWQTKFGRQVRKGAKGIMIFAPRTSKVSVTGETSGDEAEVDQGTKTHQVTSFRPVFVFDIADTDPIPGQEGKYDKPDEPQWHDPNTPSETADILFECTAELMAEMGIQLTNDGSRRGEKGFSAGGHINLSSDIEGVARASTAIHELAHELMHWRAASPFYDAENVKANSSRELKELQAESVSYTVLRHYDIPVTHHATYLAMWKANRDRIKDNLKIISDVSQFIIERIDKILAEKNVQLNSSQVAEAVNKIKNLYKRIL